MITPPVTPRWVLFVIVFMDGGIYLVFARFCITGTSVIVTNNIPQFHPYIADFFSVLPRPSFIHPSVRFHGFSHTMSFPLCPTRNYHVIWK